MSTAPSAARADEPWRDTAAAMRWALGTTPPDFLALVSLAQRAGAQVLRVVDEPGRRTPLHVASLHAKMAYAAVLIARGADVEARDSSDWTPLMTAAFGEPRAAGCGVDVARLLLTHNATVDARCNRGSTALMCSAAFGTTGMSQLLLDSGAEMDAVDLLGETALHKAALRGAMANVRFLVEHGADTTIRAHCGSTAADLAEQEGTPEQLQIAAYLRRC